MSNSRKLRKNVQPEASTEKWLSACDWRELLADFVTGSQKRLIAISGRHPETVTLLVHRDEGQRIQSARKGPSRRRIFLAWQLMLRSTTLQQPPKTAVAKAANLSCKGVARLGEGRKKHV